MIIFLTALFSIGNCSWEDFDFVSFHERTDVDSYVDTIKPIQFPIIGDFEIKPALINLADQTCK